MDIATIAVTATVAGSIGFLAAGFFTASKLLGAEEDAAELRRKLALREETVKAYDARVLDLIRENGRVTAENVALAGDARLGRKQRENLAKGTAASAAKRAAKAA